MSSELRFSEANPNSPLLANHIHLFKKGLHCGRPTPVDVLEKNGQCLYVRNPKTGAIQKINNKEK